MCDIMALKNGCPIGQRKVKGKCIPVLQKNIKASWCRKSFVGREYPFDVKWDAGRTGYGDWYTVRKGTPIIKTSTSTYNKIAKTLDSFPKEILQKGDRAGVLRDRGYSSGEYMDVFIVTDGKKQLVIDSQGYNYPRYKSPVRIDGEEKPY